MTSKDVGIPPEVNLFFIYNPRFHLVDLISTRRNAFASNNRAPPRPPNSFFLMKNCYMLELRLLGYRLAMPDLCRQAKIIWRDIPQDVKDRYDHLALQAQILHQEMYPNYRFAPKRRTTFKPYNPRQLPSNDGMGAFTVTSVTSGLVNDENSASSSIQSPRGDEIYLLESQASPTESEFITQNFPLHEGNDIIPLSPELERFFRDPLLDFHLNFNGNSFSL